MVIAVAMLAAWTAEAHWGAAWRWDGYDTSELGRGVELLMFATAPCAAITYVGLIALLITMLATWRRRYIPQAIAFTVVVASAAGGVLGGVLAVLMTRVPFVHTTGWLAVVILGWLGMGGAALGLWLCARADRRRSAARLAEVDAAIAKQQGDVVAE